MMIGLSITLLRILHGSLLVTALRPGLFRSRQALAFQRLVGKAPSPLVEQPAAAQQEYSWWRLRSAVRAGSSSDNSLNSTTAALLSSETNADALRQQAEEWKQKAQALWTEAAAMEESLQATRAALRKTQATETSVLMERLFRNRPLTPEAAAQVMKEDKWTVLEATRALEGLFVQAYGVATTESSDPSTNAESSPTPDAMPSPLPLNHPTDALLLLETQMDCLVGAAELLDEVVLASSPRDSSSNTVHGRRWSGRVGPALRSRRNELRREQEQIMARQMVVYQGKMATSSVNTTDVTASATTDDYVRLTFAQVQDQWPNVSRHARLERQVARMGPPWLPPSLLEFLALSPSTILASDLVTIKDKVLTGSAFFCTSSDSVAQAAIFRGNIRGVVDASNGSNVTARVLAEIQERLERHGLSDRLQAFLLPDPEWQPPSRDQSEIHPPPRPVVLIIPADVVPDDTKVYKPTLTSKAVKTSVAMMSVLTSLAYSISCYSLNPKFFESVMKQRDLLVLTTCLPVFFGIFAVQGIHELAHLVVARRRGIKTGLPLPLPSFQLGSWGCITPLRSFPENRSALLDFALSGPVSAMLLSLALMVAGIHLTVQASGSAILCFPVVPIALLKSSFLTGSLLTLLAPKAMVLPLSQPLPLHPIFLVGFAGLLSSALNLLPIFRLDGGRACSAAMGQRFGAVASSGCLLFLLSLALSNNSGLAFGWGMTVLLFQRRPEVLVRDEVTEVDDVRLGGWIGSLATAILALAPFPGGAGFL